MRYRLLGVRFRDAAGNWRERRWPEEEAAGAAFEARHRGVPLAANSVHRRAIAPRPTHRDFVSPGAGRAGLSIIRYGRDRRRSQGNLWRRGRSLRSGRRQRRAARTRWPLRRSMPALPVFRARGRADRAGRRVTARTARRRLPNHRGGTRAGLHSCLPQ